MQIYAHIRHIIDAKLCEQGFAQIAAHHERRKGVLNPYLSFPIPRFLYQSFSIPRWDNVPSGHQRYPLKGLNLGYMYWGQKHYSE